MRTPILLGKTVSGISRVAKRGTGSTWPGHIALKIDSNIVRKVLKANPKLEIILIAGTNGKTTTTKLIQEVLEEQGKRVFRNAAGANLLNGITSTLIKHSSMTGKINYDVAIFEVDENSLPLILSELSDVNCKLSIVLLNLFRDQLDRYGEVNSIAKNWLATMKQLNNETILITNGDDPMLRFIGENSELHSFYFGLDEKYMKKMDAPHDVDFLFCPHCEAELKYSKRSYSHMGIYKCPNCKYEHKKTATFPELPNPLFGIYNKYNINAAALLLEKSFRLTQDPIKNALKKFAPAFGRQEKIEYKGKQIFLLLSKNPTGFNQSIEAILESSKNPNILLLLNDRIPDGRDISWIWDVDTEELVRKAKQITISGDRCFDMGLRIKYSSEFKISNSTHFSQAQKAKVNSQNFNSKVKIFEKLQESLDFAISGLNQGETLYILATYSAMLDTRKILLGKAIL